METRHIGCPLCEASCGLEVQVEGLQIASIKGHQDDPLSRGHICPKAIALQDIQADPDRLRKPVRRVGDTWEEISWKDAIDLVARRIVETQQEHGRDAVGVYLGNPNVHSLGALTHGIQLHRLIRSKNSFSATSIDQLPLQLMCHLLYGHQLMVPIPDIDRTDYFLVFGGNPMASNGSLMTVPDFPGRIRELKARDGKMIVFDPRRTETARVAGEHHFIRPGTDVYVLLAMVHTLFEEDLTRPPAYVDHIAEVRAAVEPFTPELAARASGVPADEIVRIAREFAASPRAAAYGRMGTCTQRHGTVTQWAIHLLNILTGNFDREGGVMFTQPAVDVVGKGLISRGHFDKWRSRVRGLPEFGGELPVAAMAEEMLTPGKGQIKAFLTVAGNPVSSTPDGQGLAEALMSLDFMVSIDFYINETTRFADVILPPSGPLERDHYDLVFNALAVRNTARYTKPLFPQQPGTKQDWEISRDLALRILRLRGKPASVKHAAKVAQQAARFAIPPRRQLDMLLRSSKLGLSTAKLARTPGGADLGPLRPGLPGRLQTRDKRIDLAPVVVLDEVRHVALSQQEMGADDSLVLIGRRHQRDNNSWLHNADRLTRGKARHQLYMHPEDLAARGLTDGDRVGVASRVGEVEIEVASTDEMMRGVVSLPHGYGQGRAKGVRLSKATDLPGVSVNDLTDPELLDGISANAAVNGVPVTVRALVQPV
ncbi:molybdopterin-dependent oxidoreductase [Luteipulveratus mongoliensis]|uniref:Dehydrogenase n=1 Tax=Luteipulveratus mongoliensis TaxID=571913 RepID=A0A0K1JNN0_9MICO|nr:molybdopterin-dependent oxidoreductase [Luteipulveratus mongoliensis]AKU18324.1 dehydrogenase [Luteipulveratus mongoliensis]